MRTKLSTAPVLQGMGEVHRALPDRGVSANDVSAALRLALSSWAKGDLASYDASTPRSRRLRGMPMKLASRVRVDTFTGALGALLPKVGRPPGEENPVARGEVATRDLVRGLHRSLCGLVCVHSLLTPLRVIPCLEFVAME